MRTAHSRLHGASLSPLHPLCLQDGASSSTTRRRLLWLFRVAVLCAVGAWTAVVARSAPSYTCYAFTLVLVLLCSLLHLVDYFDVVSV